MSCYIGSIDIGFREQSEGSSGDDLRVIKKRINLLNRGLNK